VSIGVQSGPRIGAQKGPLWAVLRQRTFGRKRHILVDAAGFVLLAHVHAADLHDRLGAQSLIKRPASGELPRLDLVWAGGAYAGTFARWLEADRGWRVEVPKHRDRHLWRYGLEEKPKGFQVIPRRWVVAACTILPGRTSSGPKRSGVVSCATCGLPAARLG
jgi:transposase